MTSLDIRKLNKLYGCSTEVEVTHGVDPDCHDATDLCADWKRQGGCTKFKTYMADNCAKTCNSCKKVPQKCFLQFFYCQGIFCSIVTVLRFRDISVISQPFCNFEASVTFQSFPLFPRFWFP